MQEIQSGLYLTQEQMPCQPNTLRVYRYALPNILERAEREEAAARILSFSQQLDQWVGVSWPKLAQMMQEDYKLHERIIEAQARNFEERQRVGRAVRKYYALSALTLGIYSLFVKKPAVQMLEVPEEMPFSGIFVAGPQHVVVGIHELVDEGMLRIETREGEDDGEGLDIFFPTRALIQRIMERQGVVPA